MARLVDRALKSSQPQRLVLVKETWHRLECRHDFKDEICQKCGQHGYDLWVKRYKKEWNQRK